MSDKELEEVMTNDGYGYDDDVQLMIPDGHQMTSTFFHLLMLMCESRELFFFSSSSNSFSYLNISLCIIIWVSHVTIFSDDDDLIMFNIIFV